MYIVAKAYIAFRYDGGIFGTEEKMNERIEEAVRKAKIEFEKNHKN